MAEEGRSDAIGARGSSDSSREARAKIAEKLEGVADPMALLVGLFAHAPVAFQIYGADGHCLLVNDAFRELFGSEPPPEYNVLSDEILAREGFGDLVRR